MYRRGFSLIDVIVSTALLLIFFTGLLAMFRASIALTAAAKARSGATALATEQIEYIRSLTYAETGTVGGIPSGVVPQIATTTLNGIEYTTRTFVQYVDDPADGEGGADATGIITDYKRIKVEVSYTVANREAEVSLVSNRTPAGIETTEGGGTLRVQVNDALGAPLSSGQVRIQNSSVDPVVDVTTFSNNSGLVLLPGAAAGTGYQVTVTKSGHSTAQTYDQDLGNTNPDPGHLTVVEGSTTQQTFAIDILSTLLVRTFAPIEKINTTDTFIDSNSIEDSSGTVVSGGQVSLAQDESGYVAGGIVRSVGIAPTYLSAWDVLHATSTTPSGTSVVYRLYHDNGGPALIPDEDLSGNSTGFTSGFIDISSLATSTYQTLYLHASLSSGDPLQTPTLEEWSLRYDDGPTPLADIPFTVDGTKSVGKDGSGEDILKHSFATTTASNGVRFLENMEWDTYSIDATGYDVIEACNPLPTTVLPNTSTELSLIVTETVGDSLRVTVRDAVSTNVLPNASVRLTRSGYDQTVTTSSCGQAYFGDPAGETDYTVTVSAPGYTTDVLTDVTVQPDGTLDVLLDAN